LGGGGEFDAVGDAVFFGEAAGVDEALGKFSLIGGKTEAEIDAGDGRGLDLGEDVLAVERDHGFAGAGFDVGAKRFAENEKFVVDGAESGFFFGILLFDVLYGGGKIFFGSIFFIALAFGALGDPPGGVAAELCLDLSQARRAWYSLGPSFLTVAIERPET
jgi:hypothetical protein